MIDENINNCHTRPKILVAPLDWGLGHATRCIPVITALSRYADVVIAAEGGVVFLLQQEFPGIPILPLRGYRIQYSRSKKMFSYKMLLQLPKILSVISYEKNWLKKIIREEKIDAVISDNRFGLSNKNIPCVYITHQLFIQTGNKLLNRIAQKIHYRYINTFNACWVPDNKTSSLAGALSHPETFPVCPVAYTGILSRCIKKTVAKKYDYLLLLSGPEPQRTMFETMLLKQFEGTAYSFALLRGIPGPADACVINNSKAAVFNHVPAAEISALIQEAEVVIARSGYSTIMDLAKLQQKAVLVPTPGQTEQEYLATWLQEKNMFYSITQEKFSLQIVAEKMKYWQPDFSNMQTEMNEAVIVSWLKSLQIF